MRVLKVIQAARREEAQPIQFGFLRGDVCQELSHFPRTKCGFALCTENQVLKNLAAGVPCDRP
jgi:hypothetical protein